MAGCRGRLNPMESSSVRKRIVRADLDIYKQLRVRHYSIYESIALGTLAIEHIARDEMLATALTKPLDGTKNRVLSRVGMT